MLTLRSVTMVVVGFVSLAFVGCAESSLDLNAICEAHAEEGEILCVPAESFGEGPCEGEQCAGVGNIIGGLDWVDATELPEGPQADVAMASGMINYRKNGGSFRCSATLIAPDLLITNFHCAPDQEAASTVRFLPRTESDVSLSRRFSDAHSCPELVATNCDHDVAILRCNVHPGTGLLPGDRWGTVDIGLETPRRQQDMYVMHTNCDYRDGFDERCTPIKLMSPGVVTSYRNECINFAGERACENCRSDAPEARHTADTLGGSSGGGIFDARTHQLIGLNWGGTSRDNDTGGWNYFADLRDLVESDPVMAEIILPLVEETDVEPPEPLTPAEQISRARQGGSRPVWLDGVMVTALIPGVGRDEEGFVVQAEQAGPALFVDADLDDVGLVAGDVIRVAVEDVTTDDGRVTARGWRNLEVLRSGQDFGALAQELSRVEDVGRRLDDLELELVSFEVTLVGPSRTAGRDFTSFPVARVGGVAGENVELRLPTALVGTLGLESGCRLSATSPMWRYRDRAQVAVWAAEQALVDCGGPEQEPEEPVDPPQDPEEPPEDPEEPPVDPPVTSGQPCLLISEYIEGAGFNKALEFYNCGDERLALDEVVVCLETNSGSVAGGCRQGVSLEGSLEPGEVFGVCHSQMSPLASCDLIDGSMTNFNGDDRVLVFWDGDGDGDWDADEDMILDVFGELGVRPDGRVWENTTLRRCEGLAHQGEAFEVERLYSAHASDDFSDFGRAPELNGCAP